MQTISIESDLSDSFKDNHSNTDDQPDTNIISQPDAETSLLAEESNMLNTNKRIGPKLPNNSSNLRANLKDSPIYSVHDSGYTKTKADPSDDAQQSNTRPVSGWTIESSPIKPFQSSNSKTMSNKSPIPLKGELLSTPEHKEMADFGSKKTSSQTKKGAKSSRKNGENDPVCEDEQEKAPKEGNKKNNSRGIQEADINQYRHISPAGTQLKQPFSLANQNEAKGNLVRSKGSYGNLHEKNRQIQPVLRDEPLKLGQKEQQSKYISNQGMPRTLNQKIEEQAQIIQRVNLAGRELQKSAFKAIKGSKGKKQQEKAKDILEVQGPKFNQNQETKGYSLQTEDPKRRLETSVLLAGSVRTTQKKFEPVSTMNISTPSTSTSVISGKQIEPKKGTWILSDDEKSVYGDRCPDEYQKIDLLGKGGFALVWLAKRLDTGERVALKQIAKRNAKDCMQKEIHFGQTLFEEDGIARAEFQEYPGIKNIIRFIDYKHTKFDTWLVFELGGATLSKMLFEIKGEFFKGERIYNVKHQELLKNLLERPQYLKAYIRQMAEFLNLLSDLSIVHCDIKPDNVLLTKNSDLFQIKVIDFGSAFSMYEPGSFGMATPEYMPPEVLAYLGGNPANRISLESLLNQGKSWSIDVWSLGSILLEIVTGVPLWLSLKCKIDTKAKKGLQVGLFAVKGRDYEKIRVRQKAVLENLEGTIGEFVYEMEDAYEFFNLLEKMLQWDPKLRISPADILKHRYLRV